MQQFTAVAKKMIAKHNQLLDEKRQIRVLDAWGLTVGREDDPMNPTDMRHFGDRTYADLAEQMWGEACGTGAS